MTPGRPGAQRATIGSTRSGRPGRGRCRRCRAVRTAERTPAHRPSRAVDAHLVRSAGEEARPRAVGRIAAAHRSAGEGVVGVAGDVALHRERAKAAVLAAREHQAVAVAGGRELRELVRARPADPGHRRGGLELGQPNDIAAVGDPAGHRLRRLRAVRPQRVDRAAHRADRDVDRPRLHVERAPEVAAGARREAQPPAAVAGRLAPADDAIRGRDRRRLGRGEPGRDGERRERLPGRGRGRGHGSGGERDQRERGDQERGLRAHTHRNAHSDQTERPCATHGALPLSPAATTGRGPDRLAYWMRRRSPARRSPSTGGCARAGAPRRAARGRRAAAR